MTTEGLREHLEWHLRRLKGARAAAAELSLRAETDGLQWLSVIHLAVLALEASLAEEIEPDHKALEEVIADLSSAPAPAQADALEEVIAASPPLAPDQADGFEKVIAVVAPPPAAPDQAVPPEDGKPEREAPAMVDTWNTAFASLSALAFPWRAPSKRPAITPHNREDEVP